MRDSVRIEGARAIAAMTPPASRGPFNRGGLILQAPDGTIIRAQTYTGEDLAEGTVLSTEDLRELVEAGQVIELPQSPAIPAEPRASLWILRRGLPRRDRALAELRMSGLLVHSPLRGPEDAILCVVAEGRAGGAELLDRWRNQAMAEAKAHALRGEWDHAELSAGVALAVGRGLDPEVLGLLALAHEHCGRAERAEGLITMARRSRGEDFEAQVVRAREDFQKLLASDTTTPAPSATDLYSRLHAALRGFPAAVTEALGMRQDCRLTSVAAAA
jgi:hypothetical protein